MANVWRVYEGREPTRGSPWVTLPFDDAIDALDLKPEDFISDPSKPPKFGPQDRDRWFLGYRHIVVELSPAEARPPEWKPGFYRSPLDPKTATERLLNGLDKVLWGALAPIIGEANVLRLERVPHTDAIGRDTIKVTVVLSPGAVDNITGEASLEAAGRLLELCQGLGFEGTPMLQYATEAELAQTDP